MPAIWTIPATWNAGQLVTAGDLNQQVRDNLEWLKTPPQQRAEVTTITSSTSTSFVSVVGLNAITLTTSGGRVLVMFCGVISNAGGTTYLTVGVDGVSVSGLTTGLIHVGATSGFPVSLCYLTDPLTATFHTFSLMWRVSAGTAGMATNTGVLIAREV